MPTKVVERSAGREVRIAGVGVGIISQQRFNPDLVVSLLEPVGMQICNDRRSVDKVSKVEVVVIVASISKIVALVATSVASC